jgi:hypothetical protein
MRRWSMNIWFGRLDWRFVRSLGELQILTRVSYAALLIVPILPLGELQSHHLPHSWVFGFFAALAVTLGQVLYQLRAPDVVRHSTFEQFVRDARREYADQPTRERLEAADLTLDGDIISVWSPEFSQYYYKPARNIVDIERIINNTLYEEVEPRRLDLGHWYSL